jgi:hypothetical protein
MGRGDAVIFLRVSASRHHRVINLRREKAMVTEAGIIIGFTALNKLLEIAAKQYGETGKVPTYEDLEAANLLTGLKIQRLMEQ